VAPDPDDPTSHGRSASASNRVAFSQNQMFIENFFQHIRELSQNRATFPTTRQK
jgi:hypothetical protein